MNLFFTTLQFPTTGGLEREIGRRWCLAAYHLSRYSGTARPLRRCQHTTDHLNTNQQISGTATGDCGLW